MFIDVTNVTQSLHLGSSFVHGKSILMLSNQSAVEC